MKNYYEAIHNVIKKSHKNTANIYNPKKNFTKTLKKITTKKYYECIII